MQNAFQTGARGVGPWNGKHCQAHRWELPPIPWGKWMSLQDSQQDSQLEHSVKFVKILRFNVQLTYIGIPVWVKQVRLNSLHSIWILEHTLNKNGQNVIKHLLAQFQVQPDHICPSSGSEDCEVGDLYVMVNSVLSLRDGGGAGTTKARERVSDGIGGVSLRVWSCEVVTTVCAPWLNIYSIICLCNTWSAPGTRTWNPVRDAKSLDIL